MNPRTVIAILRFVGIASAPAMIVVMLLAELGWLDRGIARVDVLVLLIVGLAATFGAWATSSAARRRG
jgi:hypothetical protein